MIKEKIYTWITLLLTARTEAEAEFAQAIIKAQASKNGLDVTEKINEVREERRKLWRSKKT